MPTPQKAETVVALKKTLEESKGAILTEYRGLSVADITSLRRKLRPLDAEFHIVKNTLLKRASDGIIENEGFNQLLEGPTAIGFIKGESAATAKAILDWAKDHKTFVIKGGYVEGRLLSADQVIALSKLPTKEVLIAQMLGSLNSPITGLVGTLNGILSNFVFTLQAIADQKAAA
jgi:large subunit ribosomal protein L10